MADATTTPTTAATPTIDPDGAYTLGRAAKLTGVSRDVLRDRCEKGVLPCVRPAGVKNPHRRIRGADLIAFLRASGVTAPVTKTATPPAEPPAPARAVVRRRARAEHRRALEEIGCG
jgi:hypothetical protein